MTKRALFAGCFGAHFQALLPTARFLRRQGLEVVFHFVLPYDGWKAAAETLAGEGIQTIPPFSTRKNPLYLPSRSVLRSVWRLWRYAVRVRGMIRHLQPEVLVLPEENVALLEHVFAREAARLGVRSVVIPYSIDNPLEALEACWSQPRHQVTTGWRAAYAQRHSRWVRSHRGVQIFRLPFAPAVAMDLLGMTPPDPWQQTCSFAAAVALESEVARRVCVNAGIAPEKLVVVGSLVHDNMAAILREQTTRRAELLRTLELLPERPVFLVALPPPNLPFARSEGEFASHAEIVSFWLQTLADTGWNVVVNLHPHLQPEQVDTGGRPNVKVCLQPVSELIPLCDVFVACISAVIRWAVAAGKKTINHDLCRLRYGDYTGAPGVIHLETKAQFAAEVARVAQEVPRAVPHADWGILDGKSGERLLNLLSSLTSSSPPS